jgi:hypothetical protein
MSDPEPARRVLPWRAFVVGLLLALGIGYALRPNVERTAPPDAPAAPAPQATSEPTPAAPEVPAAPAPPAAGVPIAKAGGTLQLDRASFPAAGPVRVTLELPVTSADDSPRPVRLVSQDQRVLEISGAVESGRTAATIDVDSGYLQPGSYLVEIETTERSHFPLRRYFIIVR